LEIFSILRKLAKSCAQAFSTFRRYELSVEMPNVSLGREGKMRFEGLENKGWDENWGF
jgi:hypothetical protein